MEDALTGRLAIHSSVEPADVHIAEAAKTDPTAFGELYERYYARVYRYVFHRVANNAEAEDVTALVFMKALEGLPSYQPRKNGFAPWIFRIARNTVVDHYRRHRRLASLPYLDDTVQDDDPMHDVLGREQRAELHAMIRHLSDEQRDVVLMRYAGDLSFAEIAATLQKNEPAIRMLLHRGLRKLKAVMGDD